MVGPLPETRRGVPDAREPVGPAVTGFPWDLLPSARELGAIRHRYDPRFPRVGPDDRPIDAAVPEAPDEALLAILADPFASIDDVSARLREADRYLRARDDRRSVFLTVYVLMTDRVRTGIRAGDFADADWTRAYLLAFAERYREAAAAYERGRVEAMPDAWRVAFGASLAGRTLLIQDAFLGINAHINYDLAYALRDVGIDPDRDTKHADHDRIDGVLRGLVDVVQEALVEVYGGAGYADVDRLLGPVDEGATFVGLRESRALAWQAAVLLTDFPWAPVERYVHWRVRAVSTGLAYLLLRPSADPTLFETLRGIEGTRPAVDDFARAVGRLTVD